MTIAADLRAFAAGSRKELRTVRRYPTLLLGLLFWPVLLPAVWVYMGQAYSGANDPRALAAFAERAGTTQVVGFVFVGYAMYMWLSTLLWGPGTSLRTEQIRGSLEAVFLTPTSRLVVLFAAPVAHLPILFLTYAITLGAMWLLFGITFPPAAILSSLVVVVLGIPPLYAVASLFAAAVLRFGEIGPVVQLVRGVLVLACGITFPVAMLPIWAQVGAVVLPPTHIVAAIRSVLLRDVGLPEIAADLVVLVAFAVIIGALAGLAFGVLERSARRSGMLGRF